MFNKKIITAITATVSLAIIASVCLGVYALTYNSNKNIQSPNKPLNRGSNYEHVDLTSHLDKSKLKDLMVVINNDKTHSIFDKNKFKHYIESLIRNALSKIERFKNNANDFKIIISYQFTSDCSISIDVIWYLLKSNPYHYYDQIQISLTNT